MGHEHDRAPGRAHRIDAVRDDLEGVDVEARVGLVEQRERRLEQAHLHDLVALLLAAREALVDAPVQQRLVHAHGGELRAHQVQELEGVELGQPAMLALRIQRGLQQVDVVDARNLDRVLEREEQALARAQLGRHREQVAAEVGGAPGDDFVAGTAREHAGERALARAVRPHDRVHLARAHREREPVEDQPLAGPHAQVAHVEDQLPVVAHPTAPSRLTASRFCASTANSIGSSRNTCRQKPFTIMLTASSAEMPRCRQ